MEKQVLFIHGGGGYEEDEKLAANLQGRLGTAYEVWYPEMPDEDHLTYEAWNNQIAMELTALDSEVILVGHSLGGSILLKYLSEETVEQPVTGLFLLAPPYWGAEEWQVSEYELENDFSAKLPDGLPIFMYHSHDDEVVPFEHLALYAEQLSQATIHEMDGCGHQFNNDLSEVAHDIKRL